MTSAAVQRVVARLNNARANGSGWTARCPGHDDGHNSLSIDEGEDGRALLYCHVGCDVERIVAGLGIDLRDLFPGEGEGGE
jgi:putative DNA primase/helicase